jgi:hypothetical protein
MTTNRTKARAEDFDRALTAGAPVDPAMAALVAVAGALVALPQRPAPAFRDALRTKLMAEAATIAASAPAASVPAASAPAAPLRSLPKLLAKPAMQVATGGLAATIAATGLTVGASRSLPGDALYGLKRTVENLQVGAAGGATAEASALLEHAQTRLDEVRALLDGGDLSAVRGALDELDAELRSAVDRLLAEARDGSQAAYDRLNATISGLTGQLVALLPSLPSEARAAASSVLSTLNVAAARLTMVPRPGGPVVNPSGGPSGVPTTTPPTAPPPTTPTVVPPTGSVPVTPPTSLPVTPPTSLPVTPPTSLPVTPPTSLPVTPPTLPVTLPPLLP